MPTLKKYINANYLIKNTTFEKQNPACIVTIAGSQSIRAEDTRDLPIFRNIHGACNPMEYDRI